MKSLREPASRYLPATTAPIAVTVTSMSVSCPVRRYDVEVRIRSSAEEGVRGRIAITLGH
jgi:hypothetical protein